MAHFKDLGDGVFCVDTEQWRRGMAAAYLLRGGDEYAFVECGTSLSTPLLLQTLQQLDVRPEQVRYVMPTHVHLDHAGGAGALMRELPQAQLVMHPRGARHMIDPSALIAGATAVYGAENMQRLYGEIVPVPESRVLIADDGFELAVGDRPLKFIDAPGHARHHYVVWDARSRGFFTGDVFGLSYREFDVGGRPLVLVTTTPVQFEPQAWHETLDRMLGYSPQAMYLTHYGRVGDVERLADQLRASLNEYQHIARELDGAPHDDLVQALMRLALRDLAAHGCAMREPEIRALLNMDLDLNAQGLEVWLARQRKAAA